MNKLKQVLIALDQLVNTMLGGWADETLSSRAYRMSRTGKHWPRRVIDWIFFWELDHCKAAFVSERERAHLPPEFRV